MFETTCHTYHTINKNKHWLFHLTHIVLKQFPIIVAQ